MANKTWDYTVTVQHPDDFDKTPAQRREVYFSTKATSAPRALSKIKRQVAEEWEMEARYVEVLDACRTPVYSNDKALPGDEA
jgi:hypothetical protein